MSPRVSVLMPAYGHERFIAEAMRSVMEQTYTDLELVVVVDGSPDDTAAVAQDLGSTDRRVRVIVRSDNRGLVATLDEALTLARGEVIATIASDDVWLGHKLSAQLSAIDRGAAWVYSRARLIGEDGRGGALVWGAPVDGLEALMLRNVIPALTVLSRTDLLKHAGGWRTEALYEDYDLWLRLALYAKPAFIDDVLAEYRVVSGSLSDQIGGNDREALALDLCFQGLLSHVAPNDPRRDEISSWRRARAIMPALMAGRALDLKPQDAERVCRVFAEHCPADASYLTRRRWARELRRACPELHGLRVLRRGWYGPEATTARFR